ncbi:MAG: PAS domain S-box protein, partial [Chloroflexi bacterium]
AIFRQVLKTGQPYSAVAKLFVFPDRPDQPTYWDWSLQPVREADGQVSGLILSLIDVTEQHKAQMALAYQAFLLDHINDAIVAVDDKYCFTSWNRTAEEIYGWKREEALGKMRNGASKPRVPAKLYRGRLADSDRRRLLPGRDAADL